MLKRRRTPRKKLFEELGETNTEGLESYGFEGAAYEPDEPDYDSDPDGEEENFPSEDVVYEVQRQLLCGTSINNLKYVNVLTDIPADVLVLSPVR